MTRASIVADIVGNGLDTRAIAECMEAIIAADMGGNDWVAFYGHLARIRHAPMERRPALLRYCCRAFDIPVPAEIQAGTIMTQQELF